MSPRDRTERRAAKLIAIQNAADQRALDRVGAVTATVQLRLFHGLVPVVSNLTQLETQLRRLKGSTFIDEVWKEIADDFIGELEKLACEAARQIRHQAEELGYPIEAEIARFEDAGASIGTLQEMRETLDSLDDAGWDIARRELPAHPREAE